MKISKSKQELARIISENGGWREGEFAAQDKTSARIDFYKEKPWINGGQSNWNGDYIVKHKMYATEVIHNWHQTILSRAEFFHLYPVPDADGWIEWKGGECPVGAFDVVEVSYRDYFNEVNHIGKSRVYDWVHHGSHTDIIAYRLHKPEQVKSTSVGDDKTSLAAKEELEAKEHHPSIEQLMQIHSDRSHALSEKKAELLVAERQELEAFEALKAACREAGFDIAPITAKQEPELTITDWRDLQTGDLVWVEEEGGRVAEGEYEVLEVEVPDYDGKRTIRIRGGEGGQFWINYENGWRFIRRP